MRRRCCCGNNCTVTVTLPDVTNTSLVDGYPDNPTPQIAPYPRPDSGTHAGDCGGGTQPKCNEWPRDERSGTIATNWNTYSVGETSTEYTFDKKGQKLVQSGKAWHGARPFGFCEGPCQVESVRYLSSSRTATLEWTIIEYDEDGTPTSTNEGGDSVSVGYSVDRASGKRTLGGCSAPTLDPDADYPATVNLGANPIHWASISQGCTVVKPVYPSGTEDHADFAALSSAWAVSDSVENAYSISQSLTFNTTSSTVIDGQLVYEAIFYSAKTGGGYYVSKTSNWSVVFNATLSVPYYISGTAPNVLTDMIATAGEWDLSNDSYLPWRQDGFRAKAPICKYDETGAMTSDVGYQGCSWTDSSEYTGEIIGAPYTAGWPDVSYGFDVIDHEQCDTGMVPGYYLVAIGPCDPGSCVIPTTSTLWTSDYDAGRTDFWPGYGIFYDEVMQMQKGLEVKEIYPSYNPFPGGSRRWLLDTGYRSDGSTAGVTTAVVTAISGSDLTLDTDLTGDVAAGDLLVWIGGTEVGIQPNTIWYLDALTATTATLGAQLDVDAALVQAAFDEARWNNITQGGFGRIGRLRFQYDKGGGVMWPTYHGILGRVAVTASYDSGTGLTTFTLASAQHLITGDKVDCLDAANLPITGATDLAWTWIDSTHGKVDGDLTADVAYLKSHGAPNYRWNKTTSLGNFVAQRTLTSLVDAAVVPTVTNTEYQATGACPVIACTPNDDAPVGAVSVPFPSGLTATTCGARDWTYIIQNMYPPDWQPPIGYGDTWGLDLPAECPPLVEARTTVIPGTLGGSEPDAGTCPALPSGCGFSLIGMPTGSGSNNASCTPDTAYTPWGDQCNP